MIRFGPFRLDPANRNLTLGGRVVPLRPKTFALLEHLASNPGRLLTKEELLDAVWPDTVVGDATLKASIKEIRQALGDDAAAPRYVETAHRLGYRFVAAVEQPKVPTAMSRFIGREREVAEVRALVGRSRLVTLTGAGGSGKTRLALEALGGIAVDFDDGPWWVDLAGVSTPSLVDQAVAAILEVREHGGRPVAETVAAAIGARRALLVLDNCEHVVAAVATLVVHLLRDCPRLGILATSREALGIEGELSWLVPPLSLPGDDDALASEAVRLFLDRAATVRGRFEPSAAELGAVARIARHLDGIPLAIELAAARLKVLSLFDIVERLDDCFTLLGGGGRRAARHQTLRATMDWSHALLSAEEQALFRRIGVFVAGFSLAAAEAVGPGGIVQAGAVLDLLARLVERSLVIVPVIAAGGIADGATAAAALRGGAQAIAMGTRFLASEEAAADRRYKERVVTAHADETILTTLFDVGWPGAPHRVIRNRVVRQWEDAGRPPPGRRPAEERTVGRVVVGGTAIDVPRYSVIAPLPGFEGDIEDFCLYAGESCGQVSDIRPAQAIVADVVRQMQIAFAEPPIGPEMRGSISGAARATSPGRS